tara:strand:+ start:235 stop:1407 length:1173 start_codon:yes stop_codon:yes gene_type:complete
MIARPAVSAGSIPAGWILKPLKHNLRRLSDKGNGAGKVMALENIEGWTGKELETGSTFDGDGVKFQPDDLLFGKLRPYLAKVFLAREPGDAVGDLWALRPEPACDPKFMFYVLVNQMFIDVVNGSTNGAKMPRAEWSYVGAIGVPTPPHGDQTAIANFLDRETGRLDGLIEKKTRFIALLKEKRAAVITHAVTKGIDPDAPMKESGNPWIGMVPKHWSVSPLKFLLARSLQYGATESGDTFRPEWPRYIRITDITMSGKLREDGAKSLDPALARPYLVKHGDLLLARSGATVGKSFLYEGQDDDACFAGYMIRASADREKLLPAYLNFFFQSHTYWEFILGTQSQSTIQNVSAEKYAGLPVTVPSLLEQIEICARLQAETGKIDGLMTLT